MNILYRLQSHCCRIMISQFSIWEQHKHTSFYCSIVLCFSTSQILHFLQIESLWQLCGASLLVPLFQHLLNLCLCVTVWYFIQYFRLFLCYWDLCSVIFNVTIVIVLGCHKRCPSKMANLVDKCCVFWLLYQLAQPPSLSLSSGLPIPWDTIVKLGQLIPPTVASKCSS